MNNTVALSIVVVLAIIPMISSCGGGVARASFRGNAKTGAYSNPKCPGRFVKAIYKSVQEEAEQKFVALGGCVGATFTGFVLSYRSQVVAGVNYKMIVEMCADEYAEVVVFQPLPNQGSKPQLVSVTQI